MADATVPEVLKLDAGPHRWDAPATDPLEDIQRLLHDNERNWHRYELLDRVTNNPAVPRPRGFDDGNVVHSPDPFLWDNATIAQMTQSPVVVAVSSSPRNKFVAARSVRKGALLKFSLESGSFVDGLKRVEEHARGALESRNGAAKESFRRTW